MKMPRPEWPWRAAELSGRVTELERRLARLKASTAARQETVRELRAELAEARKACRTAARESHRLTRERSLSDERLEQMRAECEARLAERDHLAGRVAQEEQKALSRKRGVFQDRALWDLLPARVAAWRRDADADARHAHLRSVSPAYASALEAAVRHAGDEVSIAGIRWRVPADRRLPNRLSDRIANKGWLPLNQILQTREVTGGGVMIDVGANIGTTSIPRIYLGDAAIAYAAEAEPANYESLVFNVVQNGLAGTVMPDLIAIGAADGTAYLRRAGTIGGHRVLATEMVRSRHKAVPVRMLTLDSWADLLRVDLQAVRFVKVDTQGSDLFVLKGAPRILALPHVAWQLEVSPGLMAAAGATMPDLLAMLQRHFTHFIDLGSAASGTRVRETKESPAALDYVGSRKMYTNVLAWSAGRT